jgi:hypothetical protein
MRSFLVCSMVGLVVMTMAASGSAQEQPAKVVTGINFQVAPPVRVAGFHRYGQTGAYTGGSLGIGVDIENKSDKPADFVSVKLDLGGGKILEQMVSVPPNGMRMATFFDSDGLASSCTATKYKIMLSGPGTGANGTVKDAYVTPTCLFTSKVEETWNMMSPDKVAAEKAGNAYLYSPAVTFNANCGAAPTIKVKIVNKSSLSSPSLIVQAKDFSNGQVKSQTAAAFPLAAGESKDLLLTPVAANSGEPAAKMNLAIVDWSKSLQGNTSNGGIFINTTRSCSLKFWMAD